MDIGQDQTKEVSTKDSRMDGYRLGQDQTKDTRTKASGIDG